MTSTAADLPRLLALVPYLVQRPGVPYATVAADFGVTEDRLRKDLDLLYMCGSSKYYSDSLIDVEFSGDTITMHDPQGVERPLRLGGDEALTLVVALRALASTPGLVDKDPVERALAKVEAAAGEAAVGADRVAVNLAEESVVATTVRRALDAGRALRMTYWTAGRDATSDRVVDPIRLRTVGGRSYLEGWCRKAEDVRTFHLGRVQAIELLDEPSAPPEQASKADPDDGLFQPSPDDLVVRLALDRGAAWVAEYYPTESVHDMGDGTIVVTLRARDAAWIRRLALSLGAQARIVEPADLAEQVRTDARAALAAYSDGADA